MVRFDSELDIRQVATRLESWYAREKRDLPWRFGAGRKGGNGKKRGYYALVAEAMLQQTQVNRVVEYFREFVERFPSVEVLAGAVEQEVLALWQGLGYYRRARNLHRAAKMVVRDFGGRVPSCVDDLLKLPGVGRYTAGAIASIAFGERVPLVDGNVKRVIARLLAFAGATGGREGERLIWGVAEGLISVCDEPGEFNQGLMELGSLVCLPGVAGVMKCGDCPLAGMCEARKRGLVDSIPKATKAAVQRDLFSASVVVRNGRGEWLLVQRPGRGLWASMWEVPTVEYAKRIQRGRVVRFMREVIGLEVMDGVGLTRIESFVHQTSHRRVHFGVWVLEGFAGRKRVGEWVGVKSIGEYPISNAQRKVMRYFAEGATGRENRVIKVK